MSSAFAACLFSSGKVFLPVTEQIAREILSLPLYPQMGIEQVEEIANLIRDFFHVRAK